jgi:hypothetical protein
MLGTGISAGGWVAEYLIQARNGHLPDVGYVPASVWAGIFLGRVLLAEPTYRFGERRMTMMYCYDPCAAARLLASAPPGWWRGQYKCFGLLLWAYVRNGTSTN